MTDERHLSARIEAILGETARRAYRHPGPTLAVVGVLTTLAVWQASKLAVESDLSALLPETFPSVQAMHLLESRFGSVGYAVVAVWGGDGDKLKHMADDLAPVLEALPTVRYVDYTRPAAFLQEHALYFLDVGDLETVRARLDARLAWEKRKANPLLIDLEDEEPPPIDLADVKAKYDIRGDRQWLQAQIGDKYYFDASKPIIMLMAKPSAGSLDLRGARVFVHDVQQAVARFDPKRYDPRFEVGFTGRYVRRVDLQDSIIRDLALASSVALLLVLGYIALHFRRLLAVVLVMGPLLVGLSWALGTASIMFGTLTILTAFVASVLAGLGIDNGIHLLSRFQTEVALGFGPDEAVRRAFGNTGRGVAVATLTTVAGFAAVAPSEFRAFHEYGAITATGMALLMAAFFVTLPALLGVAVRLEWRPSPETHQQHGALIGFILRRPGAVLSVTALAIVAAVSFLPELRFDFDFRALENSRLPSFQLDRETNRLLGYSQTPVVVLTSSTEDERRIARELREQRTALGKESTIDFIAATVDLVPEHQQEKQPVIAAIGELVGGIRPSWVSPKLRPYLETAKKMTRAQPFSFEDLPPEVKRQFQGLNASVGQGFVLVFPAIPLEDGLAARRMARELRGIDALRGRASVVAGETMIVADILDMVLHEAPKVIGMAVITILVITFLLLGNLHDTAVAIGPAAIAMAAMLGLMPVVGLELNYLNIVVLPVVLGMSVDGGAHMAARLGTGMPLPQVVAETSVAIGGSLLTTAFGSGSLVLADHPGLESLGKMVVLGLAVNLLVCVVSLPAYLSWRQTRRARARATPTSS